jgi:hypothetical protein
MSARTAGFSVIFLRRDEFALQILDQLRMRIHVELEPALLHPHRCGHSLHLDFVGCSLDVEVGQELSCDLPGYDGVDRRVFDLLTR